MKLIDFNWDPSKRQLRQFAIIGLFALPLIAWLWGASVTVVGVCLLIGAVLASTSFLAPGLIKPLFLGLMIIATPIGWVIGELSMLLIYIGLFVPIGFVFRITGRDALNRKIDRDRESYWETKRSPDHAARYYRQS
ncbi:MAG: hypothetical protein AAGG48_00660 [Planctomycetota bacterium]